MIAAFYLPEMLHHRLRAGVCHDGKIPTCLMFLCLPIIRLSETFSAFHHRCMKEQILLIRYSNYYQEETKKLHIYNVYLDFQ